MTTATSQHQPEPTGQIVVIGGSADIRLEMARRARAAAGLGALSSAAFDAAGPAAPDRDVGGRPEQTGRGMVTAAGPAVR